MPVKHLVSEAHAVQRKSLHLFLDRYYPRRPSRGFSAAPDRVHHRAGSLDLRSATAIHLVFDDVGWVFDMRPSHCTLRRGDRGGRPSR